MYTRCACSTHYPNVKWSNPEKEKETETEKEWKTNKQIRKHIFQFYTLVFDLVFHVLYEHVFSWCRSLSLLLLWYCLFYKIIIVPVNDNFQNHNQYRKMVNPFWLTHLSFVTKHGDKSRTFGFVQFPCFTLSSRNIILSPV